MDETMESDPAAKSQPSPTDRELLEQLAESMAPRLLAYVRRVYGNLHDAEDIVAETFARAAANVDAIRASDRPDLYLLTVARNLCRDRFRRKQPDTASSDAIGFVADARPSAAEASGREEQLAALRAAVQELPESLREVVVLRLSTDMRFEEIAELLHIPLGTALSRMHNAVQRLREQVGQQYETRAS